MKRLVAFILVAAAIAAVWEIRRVRLQSERPSGSDTPTLSAAKGNSGHQLGPFVIGGAEYRVVLQEKPRLSGSTQETGNTVVKMEIQDSAGSGRVSKNVSGTNGTRGFFRRMVRDRNGCDRTQRNGFDDQTMTLDSEPSAPTPENNSWWQLFGVVDGKLKAFSGPISVQGDLLPNDSPSDVLRFKVWAHHYRLIFPVAVNWAEGKLSPAMPCDACEYNVLPEDLSGRDDLTFVRLCSRVEARCSNPERTLVKEGLHD